MKNTIKITPETIPRGLRFNWGFVLSTVLLRKVYHEEKTLFWCKKEW